MLFNLENSLSLAKERVLHRHYAVHLNGYDETFETPLETTVEEFLSCVEKLVFYLTLKNFVWSTWFSSIIYFHAFSFLQFTENEVGIQ